MNRIRFLFLTIAVVLLLGASSTAVAQVSTLPFQQYMGTYTPLTAGTPLNTLTAGGWDDGYFTLPLPFAFPFNGSTYTTVYPGTNGYIALGAGYTGISNIMNVNFTNRAGVISPMNFDSEVDVATPITYEISGAAPNRVVTIQYNNVHYFSYAAGTPLSSNYQVKLHETSGMIEFVYGPCSESTARSVYVGIASTTADFHRRVATQGSNDWATSIGNTTTSTVFSNFNATYGPPVGLTYRWGCYVPADVARVSVSDLGGSPQAFYYTPGSVMVNYTVTYPENVAYDVPITVNFYAVGDASGVPVYTTSFVAQKPEGVLNGSQPLNLNLPPGYYNIEAVFSVYNNCNFYEDVTAMTSTLLIAPGTQLCEVWPGDTDADGVVTYADRAALNRYIHEANMRPLWLNGPARYLAEAATNPVAYLQWMPQASIPWNTPDGCHKDTDGNGVINNFDYIAIKLNWLRSSELIPAKLGHGLQPFSFDMDQNYPNPFNPSTTITYALPEASTVTLLVTDMLGREVATLVDGRVDAGMHSVAFDATDLPSGGYIATVRMTGLESGLTFAKTINMALSK